jgi:NhaA family Na+:H+ antiporter
MGFVRQFIKLESASGILLMASAVLALLAANSPLSAWYDSLLSLRFQISLGEWKLGKPLLLWINDGLMAVFFLLIGLELKREVVIGQLSSARNLVLPGLAAIGGMVAPALVYLRFNATDPASMAGWAIPCATDIAFALGVLSLVGRRAPLSLKLFLLTLAVLDDLMAIIIIALFYSSQLSVTHLLLAIPCVGLLALMNARGVTRLAPYILVGSLLWLMVLKSGVHATLAGVITALFVPLRHRGEGHGPLMHLEHALHPYVAFGILPVFGFANAGVSLAGLSLADLLAPVPLGIAMGLLLGKPLGVLVAVALARLLKLAPLPAGTHWGHIAGVGLLCGIGFTMSLFIASLAFEAGGTHAPGTDRLGILMGSLLAAVTGYVVLRLFRPGAEDSTETEEIH